MGDLLGVVITLNSSNTDPSSTSFIPDLPSVNAAVPPPPTRTTIEVVPDVEDVTQKSEQKLRRSARVAACTKTEDPTLVPDALASFVDALNGTTLDGVGGVDLDSIVDIFSEVYNIDVLIDLPDMEDPFVASRKQWQALSTNYGKMCVRRSLRV